MLTLYIASAIIVLIEFVSGQSPCPDVFDYKSDGNGVYGLITVNSTGYVSTLQIRANFTIAARLPNPNYVGRIEPLSGGLNQLQDFNRGLPLQYRVDFPVTSPLPRLTAVSANENLLCYGNGDIPGPNHYVTTTSLQHTLFLKGSSPGFFQYNPQPQPAPTQMQRDPDLDFLNSFPSDAEIQVFTFDSDGNRVSNWTPNKYPERRPEYEPPVSQVPATRPPPPQYYPEMITRPPRPPPPQHYPEMITRPPPPPPQHYPETITRPPPPPPAPPTPAPTTPQPVVQTPPPRQTAPPQSPPVSSSECGMIAGGNEQPLIFHGQSYNRGDWPWLVAIYKRKDGSLTFICSGTLVSDRHVVTAAHCMQSKSVKTSMKDIVVKVGVYNLEDWGDDITVTRTLIMASIHEAYNTSSLANDISVLTFDRNVEFNTNIRAACLWNGNSDLSRIVGASGVVAGWGQSEQGQAGRGEPRVVRIPVVSTEVCRASRPDFHQLTSSYTLCAGDRKGAGPCNGDSGGGLYLLEGGRWRLRGVVSLSLRPENGDFSCNLNEFIVFTDSAQYIPWIQNVIRRT